MPGTGGGGGGGGGGGAGAGGGDGGGGGGGGGGELVLTRDGYKRCLPVVQACECPFHSAHVPAARL